MGFGHRKSFVLLTGGICLVAFMLSAVVAQQKAAVPPNAKAPVAKGPTLGTTGSTNLSAKLQAKIPASKVIPLKATAIPFKAFTYADLKDPKTGQPITANSTVTAMPSGVQVSGVTYLTAINKLQASLNAAGFSLNSGPANVTVMELAYNKPMLEKQAAAAKALPAPNAKLKAITVASLQQQFQTNITAEKASATAGNAATTAKGAKGAKAAEGAKGAKGTAGATAENATAGAKGSQKSVVKIPPGEVAPILGTVQPYTYTKSYTSPQEGDPDIFAAQLSASTTLKADGTGVTFNGTGKATGWVFGNSSDLLVATASAAAPKSGNLTANIKVTLLGTDESILNESQSANLNKSGSPSFTLPDVLKVQYNFVIYVVPCTVVVGVKGNVSMPYYVGLSPMNSIAYIIPHLQAAVYGQAGIGGEVDSTGASTGIEVDFTLVNNTFTLLGEGSEGTDSKGTFFKYDVLSREDLTALAGSVSAYIEVEIFGWKKQFSYTIYNFPAGIVSTTTPFADDGTVYLPTTQLENAPPNR